MYVNMNGILAAQRPGLRAGGVRDPARASLWPAPWPGRARALIASWHGFPGPRGAPLRLPIRVCRPCGSWRARVCLAPLGALWLAGPPGRWVRDVELGRRFILRSLGMIRSIVTGFSHIYEGRSCVGGPA